jgi:hypothetical protein
VVGLAAGPHPGLLGLDEVAHPDPFRQLGALAQTRIGADPGCGADPGSAEVTEWLDHGVIGDLRIRDHAMGSDADPVAQDHRPLEQAADIDLAVRAGIQVAAQIEPSGVVQGDPAGHQRLRETALEHPFEPRQLDPVVDPGHLVRVTRVHRHHGHTIGDGEFHQIGEVVLTLGVVRREPVQPVGEAIARQDVDARVDLVDGALPGVGIPFLDDAGDVAVGVAQDPAEAGGIGGPYGDQAQGIAGNRRQQALQGSCGQQRDVPVEDQDPGRVTQLRKGRAQRIAGALLGVLHRQYRAACGQRLPDTVGIRRHDHDAAASDRVGAGQDAPDHRDSAQGMQDLGQRRAHAGPLSGGQHHRHRIVGTASSRLP